MKIFGYPRDDEDKIHDLLEITLVADPSRLRSLAKFIEKRAEEMEDDIDGWEHCHYSDEDVSLPQNGADVIVFNPRKL